MNIEAVLASHIARRAVVVGPILVAIFWITRGGEGAIAAAFGVVLVVANFLLAGAMLSVAAKISPPSTRPPPFSGSSSVSGC